MRCGFNYYIGERSASEILCSMDELLDQLCLFLLDIHRSIDVERERAGFALPSTRRVRIHQPERRAIRRRKKVGRIREEGFCLYGESAEGTLGSGLLRSVV